MSRDPYSARVRELFAAPAHAGELDSPLRVAIEDQGVRISLFAEVSAGEVQALRFKAWGCPHVIAGAEAFCAACEGGPIAGVLEFSASDLMQSLSVPAEKTGRILVIEDAVHALGDLLEKN